ncbi:helix-turn-helix domain-containing protein [Brachymonas sp. J145]|uniref:helix-turn-helix domain-containing protein n=1 Tax=Brachymonas sp. J145 TaxID=3116489 RepID=UPI002E79D147|nr:helix-turn-helix transcriptional regulator [Brachymonas sp. J145]MEE1653762.1 helix-turn-helix transcriptional regulator [Brachymonas sp. J145]
MSLQFQPDQTPRTVQIQKDSETWHIDISSAEFQSSMDMGSVQVGHASMRVTVVSTDLINDESGRPAKAERSRRLSDYLRSSASKPGRAEHLSAAARELATSDQVTLRPLTRLRLNADMTQAKLAGLMGVSQPNIAKWERDPGNMTCDTQRRLAKALGITFMEVAAAIDSQHQNCLQSANRDDHATA